MPAPGNVPRVNVVHPSNAPTAPAPRSGVSKTIFDAPTLDSGVSPLHAPPVDSAASLDQTDFAVIAIEDDVPSAQAADPSLLVSAGVSIRQYAAVRVEIEMNPAIELEVLQSYHLTAELEQRLRDSLRVRCAQDPATLREWQQAFATYLNWWMENRFQG